MTRQLITNTQLQLSSLAEFVTQVSELESPEDSVLFSLKEEIILAKHTLTFFRPVVERSIKLVNSINKKLDAAREKARATNSPIEYSREDITTLATREQALLEVGEKLQDNLLKIGRLVKQGTEIEAIKANRLDSVQLLAVLQQIPSLILDTVKEFITHDILDPIQNRVEQVLANDTSDPKNMQKIMQLRKELPLFGRMKDMVLSEMLGGLMSELDNSIRTATVVPHGPHTAQDNTSAPDMGVTQETLQGMLSTVPTGPPTVPTAPDTHGGNGP